MTLAVILVLAVIILLIVLSIKMGLLASLGELLVAVLEGISEAFEED